jgi:hypothetical protein
MKGGSVSEPLSEVKHEVLVLWFSAGSGPEARKAERPPRTVPRKAKRTDVRAGV